MRRLSLAKRHKSAHVLFRSIIRRELGETLTAQKVFEENILRFGKIIMHPQFVNYYVASRKSSTRNETV